MQWIVVKTFSFPYEAQIAKTQLEHLEFLLILKMSIQLI